MKKLFAVLLICLLLCACAPPIAPSTKIPETPPCTTVVQNTKPVSILPPSTPVSTPLSTVRLPELQLNISRRSVEIPAPIDQVVFPAIDQSGEVFYRDTAGNIVPNYSEWGYTVTWRPVQQGEYFHDFYKKQIGDVYIFTNNHDESAEIEIQSNELLTRRYQADGKWYQEILTLHMPDLDFISHYSPYLYVFPDGKELFSLALLTHTNGEVDSLDYVMDGNGYVWLKDSYQFAPDGTLYQHNYDHNSLLYDENSRHLFVKYDDPNDRRLISKNIYINTLCGGGSYAADYPDFMMMFHYYHKDGENFVPGGYIDPHGNMYLTDTRPASDFNEGAAVAVDAQGQHYYMDTNGRMLFDKRFIYAWNFKEGLAAVSPDGKHYGFIDKSGEYAIEPIYSFDALENVLNKEVFFSNGHADMDHYIMHFNNGYAIIADERTRTAAYIDKNGETLFDFYVPEDFFDYDPI